MSCGSNARLSRFSIGSRAITLSRELFRLTVDHFPRDQLVLERSVAIGKATPLLLPLLWGGLRLFGSFDQFFKGIGHGCSYIPNRWGPPLYIRSFKSRYTGKLSCFLAGISTVLPRSIASARAMRERVACGMMTSSI